jgi:hypothetical protein
VSQKLIVPIINDMRFQVMTVASMKTTDSLVGCNST